jgi:serine/threonine-protein kinase ATR
LLERTALLWDSDRRVRAVSELRLALRAGGAAEAARREARRAEALGGGGGAAGRQEEHDEDDDEDEEKPGVDDDRVEDDEDDDGAAAVAAAAARKRARRAAAAASSSSRAAAQAQAQALAAAQHHDPAALLALEDSRGRARVQLQLALWTEGVGQGGLDQLRPLFEAAAALDPTWDAPHFAYAAYLDELYVDARERQGGGAAGLLLGAGGGGGASAGAAGAAAALASAAVAALGGAGAPGAEHAARAAAQAARAIGGDRFGGRSRVRVGDDAYYGEYLPAALRHYGEAARLGSRHVRHALPRLLTLFFEHCEDQAAAAIGGREGQRGGNGGAGADAGGGGNNGNAAARARAVAVEAAAVMRAASRGVPTHRLLLVLPQLTGRVHHPSPPAQELVGRLMARVLDAFPQQGLWALASVARSSVPARAAAAESVLNAARGRAPTDARRALFESHRQLVSHVIKLCHWAPKGLPPGAAHPRALSAAREAPRLVSMLPVEVQVPTQALFRVGGAATAPAGPLVLPQQQQQQVERTGGTGLADAPALPTAAAASSSAAAAAAAAAAASSAAAPTIAAMRDEVAIMASLQRPKRITFVGSDGRDYPFLAKPKDDLRKDYRLMDFVGAFNDLLALGATRGAGGGGGGGGGSAASGSAGGTGGGGLAAAAAAALDYAADDALDAGGGAGEDGAGLSLSRSRGAGAGAAGASGGAGALPPLRTYAVTALTEECGLIEWVGGLVPFKQACEEAYVAEGLYRRRETPVRIKRMYDAWQGRSRADLLRRVLALLPPRLHRWFLRRWPEPGAWLSARLAFTRTNAAWCMVGHALGLGDRHGENVMVHGGTGETMHVDFGCLFDRGLVLEVPEMVPFRLTQNVVDAFGVSGVEGAFRRAAEGTLRVMREHKAALMACLETFLADPLVEWSKHSRRNTASAAAALAAALGNGSSSASAAHNAAAVAAAEEMLIRMQGQDALRTAAGRVAGTLLGVLCVPSPPTSVEGHAARLIEEATDLERLGSMFIWWMPWM